jgi:hypothetical protein
MSNEFLSSIPAALRDVLERWSTEPTQDLASFLDQTVSSTDAKTILAMVDGIRAADEALQASGLPAKVWLGEELQARVPDLSDSPVLGDWAGLEPHEIGARIIELGLAGLGEVPAANPALKSALDALAGEGIPVVNDFFSSGLGAAVEREVVSVASAVVVKLARSMGIKARAEVLTSVVDLGLRLAKVAFHQQSGHLDSDEAYAAIEDRIACVARAGAEALLVAQLPDVTAKVGTYIGLVLGNPLLGHIVGRSIGELAAPMLRPIVHAGADKMARKALSWSKEAPEHVKTLASTLLA